MRNEQAEEEKKYSKIKELARTIKKSLLNGEAISDEVYAELLIEYIKIDFPMKEDYEVSKEIIDRVERKEQILEEIEKNKEQNANRPKAFEKRDRELNEELMKISIEASKGFVLVNYPNTYNQAKILENKLSGYVNENESPELKSTKLKNIFEILLDKSEKILPPFKLITGGFDFIFYLNVPGTECVRRAIGRRVFFDEKTGMKVTYHLEDNKPPVDSGKNICEKLKKIDDDNHSESSLVTRHLAFENSINQVVNFYQPFGFEEKGLKSFEIIDGNRELDYVTQDILSYVNQLVELNEQKDQEIYDNQEEESYENDEENMSENALVNNLEEKKEEEKKEEEKKEEKEEKKEENEEKKEENEENKENISQINEDDKNLVPNENEEEKILDPFSEYTNKIQKIKETLNPSLSDVLLKIWSKLFENYVNECKSIFKFLRVQRDQISINYNLICQKFIEFLKRPSKKQILLLDYQMKYNKFLDDYPDIKDDPQVKEEHHQEVDDLNDKIYEIIENRKNEAVDERKKIMTSGWIENEMEKFFMALERLFQNEIDKFIGSMQIMRDYYHNLDNKPLIELPFSTIDIIKEEADSTPLEEFDNNVEDENNNNNNEKNENENNENENDKAKAAEEINEKEIEKNLPKSYPRLEKLYKECLKVQFQYEDAIREAEKQKQLNEAEANKKAAAANKGKKDKNAKNEPNEEEKIEPSEHEEEMKQALSNEKAKYKYKITLLKYWGISTLKNLRRLSLSVYNKLEDWIILAIKAENEALNQLTEMLKENIENESKIKYELALDTFDVIVNMDIQNYIELPPKLLPAKEVINHDKFNITQLQILMEELKTYLIEDENNSNFIRSSTFINIFIKKFIASRNDNDVYYGIPNMLKNLNFYNYFKFIKKLDPNNSDLVSLKQIGTYFALLNSNVPSEDDIKNIVDQCEKIINYYENPEIEKEQFVNIKFWFDENEKSETLPNHEDFHREVKLKEVLFDINKNNEEKININNFIDILNLHCLNLNSEKLKDKNYYEVLFF